MLRLQSCFAVVCCLAFAVSQAHGAVAVGPSDFTGSRSNTTPGQLKTTDGWLNNTMTLSWTITHGTGVNPWTYTYTFANSGPSASLPSFFALEVGSNMSVSQLTNVLLNGSTFASTVSKAAFGSSAIESQQILSSTTYKVANIADMPKAQQVTPGDNQTSPTPVYMPNDINGISYYRNADLTSISFQTNLAPAWGDFFAVDSQAGGIYRTVGNAAYYPGGTSSTDKSSYSQSATFADTEPTVGLANYNAWIPVPSIAPEPSSILAWSAFGLCFAGVSIRRRLSKRADGVY